MATTTSPDLLLYVPTLDGGGAERVFVRLANHYAAQGRSIALAVNRPDGPIADLVDDGVRVIPVGADNALRGVPRLVGLLKREQPRAVISGLTTANLAMSMAARYMEASSGSRPRLMVCERNEFTTASRRLSPVRRQVFRSLVRRLYPRADVVSGNASGVAEDLARVTGMAPAAIKVIPNPSPEAEDIAAARTAPPPHPWFAEDVPVALAMGRLVAQKDYPTMLRALARCEVPLRLIILGDGGDRAALEALVRELDLAERVCFAGFQLNRFEYLAHCDLFVMSSLTEGFPNALIEAISFGVPSVSTDCAGGGPSDILAEELPEALVPVGDADAMAQAMARQVSSAADPARIAAIAERYTLDSIADRFMEEALP
ncbi:glycosyltransferase involved in cell wall biosynthesis [Aliiruegeria haliotis]|uniref:Glycosyltransferase involved in cell wall biosynthesis n=1 Tax=Aliiruegeria haliotis TaxID=1280846 RepID=A0A2T0S065_9RHOB|nr:glycosyltransferase [Aliiruegeria haliotis]PRY26826.1 glycosyltransferase involved in cell wall biosynthesis [Aliiruegeria haliotis]